jgi:hypothetical protein
MRDSVVFLKTGRKTAVSAAKPRKRPPAAVPERSTMHLPPGRSGEAVALVSDPEDADFHRQ